VSKQQTSDKKVQEDGQAIIEVKNVIELSFEDRMEI